MLELLRSNYLFRNLERDFFIPSLQVPMALIAMSKDISTNGKGERSRGRHNVSSELQWYSNGFASLSMSRVRGEWLRIYRALPGPTRNCGNSALKQISG